MTPNPASSAAAAAVLALALLVSPLPSSSFAPVTSRGQIACHRSGRRLSSRFSGSSPASAPRSRHQRQRQPPSSFTTSLPATTSHHHHQLLRASSNSCLGGAFAIATTRATVITGSTTATRSAGRRASISRPLSLGGSGLDGFDPLEEGPDPDDILLQGEPELLRQQQEEEEYEEELAEAAESLTLSEKAPTKMQIAEEAVAAAAAAAQANEHGSGASDNAVMASLDPKRRKGTRTRIDPLMPRGAVAPNEWKEMDNLEEGVRGILVVCHTGLPRDKKRADQVMKAVKDRFGHVIHTHEWWDDDPELTDDDREETDTFEVWLEGPTVVHYHERANGQAQLDDEQLRKILEDLECRVEDRAILGQYVNEDFQFRLPGFRAAEQRRKQFPVL